MRRLGGRARLRGRASRTARQAFGYAASEASITGLAAISTALVAHALSTDEFGSLSFSNAFLLFTALFFDFGIFLPAARLAARADREERRGVVGAALALFVPIGIGFSLAILAVSFGVDSVFNVDASTALLVVAPIAFAWPFQVLAQYLAQGTDRLHVYSITAAGAQAVYVVALVVVLVLDLELSVQTALLMRGTGLVLGWVALVLWLRPRFAGTRERGRELIRGARAYGANAWLGRVLSIGTYNMDVLMLASFTAAEDVGFYVLAGAIAYLVGLPVLGAAAALFPQMTEAAAIPRRWLTMAWASGAVLAAGVSIAAYPLVPLVFSDRYSDAAPLVLPLALAAAVRGVTTVYNQFLQAHGQGRDLRDAAIVLTASNVVFNFLLIPPFGAPGAAWASLIALGCNLIAHIVLYRRSLDPAGSGTGPAAAADPVAGASDR